MIISGNKYKDNIQNVTTDLKICVILIVEGESLHIVWLCSEESDLCTGKKE